jgi:polyketide synthase PksJ
MIANQKKHALNNEQKIILNSSRENTDKNLHITQVTLDVNMEMDSKKYWKTWEELITHFHYLKSTLIKEGNTYYLTQKDDDSEFEKTYIDLSKLREEERKTALANILKKDLDSPLNIFSSFLFRLLLVKTKEDHYTLVFTHHHILLDFTSFSQIMIALIQLYKFDKKPDLQQKEIINKRKINKRSISEKENSINTSFNMARLPGKKERRVQHSTIRHHQFELSNLTQEHLERVKNYCNSSCSEIFYTIWAVLLCKFGYTFQTTFGVVRRPSTKIIKNNIGLLVQSFPLSISLEKKTNTLDVLKQIQSRMTAIREQSNDLSKMYELTSQNTHAFESIIDYKNGTLLDLMKQDFPLEVEAADFKSTTNLPLAVEIWRSKNRLFGRIGYDSNEFDENCIFQLDKHINSILTHMALFPEEPVGGVHLGHYHSKKGNRQSTDKMNKTALYHSFCLSAKQYPNKIAVQTHEGNVTFKELMVKSTQLAKLMTSNQDLDQKRIAICLDRNIYFIIAVVAANATNSSIIILDPLHPKRRLDKIIALSNPTLIIAESKTKKLTEGFSKELIDIDHPATFTGDASSISIKKPNLHPYILFTSGSTGEPKGTYIPLKGIVNTIQSLTSTLNLSSRDTNLAVSSIAFDMAIVDIWLPLVNGATLYFSTNLERRSPEKIIKIINERNISFIEAPPTFLASLIHTGLNQPKRKIQILSGGETLTHQLAQSLLTIGKVYNLYGPTENSIYTTLEEVSANHEMISIGNPLNNIDLRIVDIFDAPCPNYALGEILISGIGLSPGYLSGDEIKSPYRTNDLACFQQDGRILYSGRLDNQMKIYGNRVNISEIVNTIESIPGVKTAVVFLKTNNDIYDGYLASYIVPKNIEGLKELSKKIKTHLVNYLPYYMIPAKISYISRIETTVNGKIDYEALHSLALPLDAEIPQINNCGKTLQEIWARTLQSDQPISNNTSFFDAGGSSILFNELLINVQDTFNCSDISIVDLYRNPTIKKQADLLHNKRTGAITRSNPIQNLAKKNEQGDIAIIGYALRFPEANTPDEYWEIIKNQRIVYKQHRTSYQDENYISISGTLKETYDFDHDFFNYTAKEAEEINPQHRLFLEVCHEALASSGYPPSSENKLPVGVFSGAGENYYNKESSKLTPYFSLNNITHQINTNPQFIATRVSHKLNLSGPSLSINTACSTSLVSIIKACQSIHDGESSMALAGGASLILPENAGYLYQEGAIFSKSGSCNPFDATADGTVPSSGVGVLLLKSLESAIADGDTIHGVINSFSLNNDGREKMSFTSPSDQAQAECLNYALSHSKNWGGNVSYIEAHATGTEVGDPIEMAAIQEVYSNHSKPIAVGSVKSNIGHTNQAAGIAGLLKIVLMMKHDLIPAQANYTELNPTIDFNDTPFYIPQKNIEWKVKDKTASVSSFGLGGTNAHLILSNYTAQAKAAKNFKPSWKKTYHNINRERAPQYEQAHTRQLNHSNLSETIINIWKDLFQINDPETKISFFDLGGDSIKALEFISDIQTRTGISLHPTVLQKHQSIDQLLEYIQDNTLSTKESKCITCIQDRGAKNNLFLLHPVGGTSYCYIPMSEHVSHSYNIYAISDPDIDSNEIKYQSINELALFYADKLEEFQPTGKYHLSGLSLGGVLAVEIATILLARGKEIGFIGLIESWAKIPADLLDMNVFFNLIQRQHEIILKQIKNSQYNLNSTPWLKIQHARMSQLYNHKHNEIAFPVVLLKAKETNAHFKVIDDEYNHWKHYTKENISVYTCQGNHETILYENHGKNIASLINQHLEEIA